MRDFRAVLALEPNNRQASEELRALREQQREALAAQQQMSMQQAAAAGGAGGTGASAGGGAAAAGGGAAAATLAGLLGEEGLGAGPLPAYLQQVGGGGGGGPAGMDPLAGMPPGAAAGPHGAPPMSPEEYAALLAKGEVPLLAGPNGEPMLGPRGEHIFLGPDGVTPMMIGPDGQATPLDFSELAGEEGGMPGAVGGGPGFWQ